ncbi:hypothetical protein [Virgibacillus pantothenticus]|uniref:hypothetical protein n=1 Tax=Virgibacillus pantothenticus TaxID=1473 RepID=UPI0009851585|nr:hypothetical protein [Virgibacillus pantothenticus]
MIAFVLVTGCDTFSASTINIISFQPKDYDVIFYTHQNNNKLENLYFDAIIEIKADYPSEFSEVKTREVAIDEVKDEIDPKYPTLIIRKDNKMIERITGQASKQEIINKLKNLL